MKKLNKNIAKAIIAAQMCSDAGKGLFRLKNQKLAYKAKKKYPQKDTEILKAIEQINRLNNTGFYYSVKHDYDIAYYIVYFNFQLDGKRKQISFHSFDRRLEKFVSSKCSTRWDKKDSREAARELMAALNI